MQNSENHYSADGSESWYLHNKGPNNVMVRNGAKHSAMFHQYIYSSKIVENFKMYLIRISWRHHVEGWSDVTFSSLFRRFCCWWTRTIVNLTVLREIFESRSENKKCLSIRTKTLRFRWYSMLRQNHKDRTNEPRAETKTLFLCFAS